MSEPCPDCGCPAGQYDGHCCEGSSAAVPDATALAQAALDKLRLAANLEYASHITRYEAAALLALVERLRQERDEAREQRDGGEGTYLRAIEAERERDAAVARERELREALAQATVYRRLTGTDERIEVSVVFREADYEAFRAALAVAEGE